LVVAVLPWIAFAIDGVEFGGWKIKFRELQEKVDHQQRLVNDLVQYSISASIFHHLCGIGLLREYRYRDGDGNRREMYFLRDNGYIRPRTATFLDFGPSLDAQNLVELSELTPIGWNCLKLRRNEIPTDMITDHNNLQELVLRILRQDA
jgi:hypothetical protein